MDIVIVILGIVAIFGLLGFILFLSGFRNVKEYEKLAIYYLGNYSGTKGPGLVWIWPLISKTQSVDLRETVIEIPRQEAITVDNVTVFVTASVKMRVIDPGQAINNLLNIRGAVTHLGMTTLREIIGKNSRKVLLEQRNRINNEILLALKTEVEHRGIEVSLTEIKEIDIPEKKSTW